MSRKNRFFLLLFQTSGICLNVFVSLHQGTVIVFIMASLLVTSRQYFGDPIDCIVDDIPGNVMDTYCWIHSTFSIPARSLRNTTPLVN